MDYKILKGRVWIEALCADEDTCNERFWLERPNGDMESLLFAEGCGDEIPLDCIVSLRVYSAKDGDSWVVADDTPAWLKVEHSLAAEEASQVIRPVMVRVIPEGEVADESVIRQCEEWTENTENWLRAVSHDKWDVKCAYIVFNSNDVGLHGAPWRDIRDAVDAELPDFNPTHYWGIGGYGQGICGRAWVGGTQAWTYSNHHCGWTTWMHEGAGHNLGCRHDAKLTEDGRFSEYGGSSSILASGHDEYYNALHMDLLGLIRSTQLGTSRTMILVPCEWDADYLMEGETQLAYVEGEDEDGNPVVYGISTRTTLGECTMATNNERRVFISKWEDENVQRKSVRLMPELKEGESRELPGGVTITFVEYLEGACKVAIQMGADVPDDREFPVFTPTVEGNIPITEESAGLWRFSAFKMQGLEVHYVPARDGYDPEVVVMWYTHKTRNEMADGGKRGRWFIGQGPVEDGIAYLTLRTGSGGSNLVGGADMEEVGTAWLWFDGENTGHFVYETEPHQRGHIPLKRLSGGVRPISGLFYKQEHTTSGVSVAFLEDNRLTAYWYTYDYHGNPRWLMALSDEESPSDVTFYEVRDGLFRSPISGKLDEKGTGNIRYDPEDDTVVFQYDLGNEGAGQWTLTRLT